ncbi:hypothetical protein O1611_g10093 [Lasiodiplodia mahajangana]|uniref:Uncharacterized protein n=1 Tax=Lasiodiplodia mahajangana TaxID=1108764 RepID=A0ACC2J1Z3_9PEZI|nr:hypothetical protein O1611_g10093 [Lasiodiplodia mahajangana]
MRTTVLASVLGAVISTVLAAPQNAASHTSAMGQDVATHTSAAPQDAATAVLSSDANKDKDKDIVKISYGQQMQIDDQANHWVVWLHGKDSCPPLAVLGSVTQEPCGQNFTLPSSETLQFAGCDDDNEPHVLLSEGKFVRSCKVRSIKATVHCHGKEHNVIKHGKCINVQ